MTSYMVPRKLFFRPILFAVPLCVSIQVPCLLLSSVEQLPGQFSADSPARQESEFGSAWCGSAAFAKMGRKGKYTESESEHYFAEGQRKLKADDLDGAIDAFLQATYFARNGYYPEAYYWLGVAYMDKRTEDKKAVDALEKSVEQSVDEKTNALIALAEIHLRNDRYEEVDKAINRIHAYDDKTRESVQYIEGQVADRQGHYGEAEGHYRNALGREPWTWTKVWILYGEAMMKQKKWKDAYKEFRDIDKTEIQLKRLPNDRLNHDMGVCKLAIGDHQGALDHFNRALDYNPKNAEVWLQRAMLLESEQHLSNAIKDYKQFLRFRSDDGSDPRVAQVKDRITKIEHMLRANETAPQAAPPSPYMRKEMENRINQEDSLMQQRRRLPPSGDSGF